MRTCLLTVTGVIGLVLAQSAGADNYARSLDHPAYRQECGSCHTAFPPPMMGADSWKRVMGNLDRHFGSDASLDKPTAAEISRHLEQNASQKAGSESRSPEGRLTETERFIRKHRKVTAAQWKDSQIRSAANCAACHTNADSGRYSEHEIRLPRSSK